MSYYDLLASCPGACGDLARAFNYAHESDQPGMALAAAIATMSTIKCGRVEWKEVQPNLFFCMLGGSGVGKTQMLGKAKKAIEAALVSCLEVHPPASGVALFERVAMGERLLIWDEFGEVLKQVIGSKNGYALDILRRIKILFNQHRNIKGNAYAKNSMATITDIDEGYFTLLSASTPEHIQDILQSDFVKDGLVPRFLFIESEKFGDAHDNDLSIPKSFLSQAAKYWRPKDGDLIEAQPIMQRFEECPKQELMWAPDALTYAKQYREYTRTERRHEANEAKLALYNRKFEIFLKIVLSIADNNYAEAEHVSFAEQFVEHTIGRQVDICMNLLGRTNHTKADEEVLAAVPKDKWVSLSEIHLKTRGLAANQRREILADLVAREEIFASVDNEALAKRKPLRYTRSSVLYQEAEANQDPAYKRKLEADKQTHYMVTGLVPEDEYFEIEL